jgi:hypothetical protein
MTTPPKRRPAASPQGATPADQRSRFRGVRSKFGCGRALRALDFACAKSACAEVERGSLPAGMVPHG